MAKNKDQGYWELQWKIGKLEEKLDALLKKNEKLKDG